ncbi:MULTISPECIES: DsbA family protein [Pontibacillus]|uniref:Thioredoxin domain-containing protein n=1 Tax=Pontibacillus chungwhensis TaxID=265426 RepID=A0ABY8V1J5_9BACI|nr:MULTISPECIES: thioredoxin domain-containing protein [Pontibacillus]MCD5322328.1 thioredoxin domain-containing protein [Pontibacillus sp. HN14]WIF99619.1 thioredoxin domain-containing protein [Pontibacillus chungwhensis]
MAKTKQKSSNAWIYWMIGIIAAAVIIIVIVDRQMDGGSGGAISYEDQPFIGEEDAPVSMIEFYDYLCPHCQDYQEVAIPEIKQKLIDSGKAKLYLVNLPIIGDSNKAARFGEAVFQELGSETFVEYHEYIMGERIQEAGIFTDQYLEEALSSVVDDEEKVEQVVSAYQDGAGEDAVSTDRELASDLNVHQTPTIVVDGEVFEGATFEELEQAVDEAANE